MKKTAKARDVEIDATLHTNIQLGDLRDLAGRNISVRIGEKRVTLGKVTRIHVHSRGDDQKRAEARGRKSRKR